jgi:hypothetical protein
MPDILRLIGLRFFFYSDEHLPIHVHVRDGDGEAKFKIDEDVIILIANYGMKAKNLKLARIIIADYRDLFLDAWIKHFIKE